MKLLRSCLSSATLAGIVLVSSFPLPAAAAARAPAEAPPDDPGHARVIVSWRADSTLARKFAASAGQPQLAVAQALQQRTDVLSARVGVALKSGRAVGERAHVVTAGGLSSAALAARLAVDPEVAWAVPDRRRRALMVPNDPLYSIGPPVDTLMLTGGPADGQWYLRAPTDLFRSAINAPAAWDRTIGSTSVVVAVLDTGVRFDHADLSGRLLSGYDMVDEDSPNDFSTANDGNGRDSDASDPGDWITAAEDASGGFAGCGESDSSWHGTQVSAIVGAATNNALGMAGIAHGARILPVRVLGKCGGYDSDIIAGMRWAAGIAVPGVPANPTPAKVLNMSLGGSGGCSASYRDAVDDVVAQGAVVVAAAGNSAGHAVSEPANCSGVVAVAGLRHAGTKVGFSDLGPEIAIAAPGGNCINLGATEPCLYPILTASNAGARSPVAGSSIYTDAFNASLGTSFATPIVAGTAALVMSAQPGLTPAEVRQVLRSTARAFPTSGADNGPDDPTPVVQCVPPSGTDQLQCYCTTALCGAGMLDAAAAVAFAADGLFVRVGVSPSAPRAGAAVTVSGAGSVIAAGRTAAAWQWTLVDGGGVVSAFDGTTTASSASFTPSAAGAVVVRLTVTDSQGASASADQTITVAAASSGGGGGGGGGGAMSAAWLAALAAATAALGRRRRR
jgi:serine protease